MSTSSRTDEALRPDGALSAYGRARSTVEGSPLSPDELRKVGAYWRASLYLCLGMLYLKANPLLREPLTLEHIKPRLPNAVISRYRVERSRGPAQPPDHL
jgi:xylulose-5-phosphate/fructose-6-phosphate phosphoketolase